jgi:hypothetical protein
MVEREDVRDGIVQVLSLIEKGLSVECREIFIKVHGEEVQCELSLAHRLVVPSNMPIPIMRSFGSE